MRIVVAGAGLVGLATAAGLEDDGHEVVVVEQAPVVRAAGAGIGLWENGLAQLDSVGVGERLRSAGHVIDTWFYDRDGRRVRAQGYREEDHRFLLVPRPLLSDELVGAVGADHVVTGERVIEYLEERGRVVARLESGREIEGDLLIGADGAHSRVRRQLVPGSEAVPHGTHTAWRAVVPSGGERPEGTVLTIGADRTRGGYSRVGPDQTMWMVNQFEVNGRYTSKREQAFDIAQNIVGAEWHRELLDVIERTPEDAILENRVLLVPRIETWVSDRVALIGDAAHALSPHISAGGTLGLEDIGVLRAMLREESDLSTALRRYQEARIARFDRVRAFSAEVEHAETAELFAEAQTALAHWMTTTSAHRLPHQ